jgi:hypothetical protein
MEVLDMVPVEEVVELVKVDIVLVVELAVIMELLGFL